MQSTNQARIRNGGNTEANGNTTTTDGATHAAPTGTALRRPTKLRPKDQTVQGKGRFSHHIRENHVTMGDTQTRVGATGKARAVYDEVATYPVVKQAILSRLEVTPEEGLRL